MRFLALCLAFVVLLQAQELLDYSDEPSVQERVLYSSLEPLPLSVYQGQLFPVTYKTLSTEDHFQEISYSFSNGSGVSLFDTTPQERREGPYRYHTFYFLAKQADLRLPDASISLLYSNFSKSDPIFIRGERLKVITLNPPENFVNLLAKTLRLQQYKANAYDEKRNIVLFSLSCDSCDISHFSIPFTGKQGFESNATTTEHSELTYYTLVPKHLEELRLSFFNTDQERFDEILIPIVVLDDSVSTQSDLKPRDQRHTQIKLFIALGIAVLFLLLFFWRRKFFYLFIVITAGGYGAYIGVPIEYACVKGGTPITLLPMERATVFKTTTADQQFVIEGEIEGYIKIKLDNNHIGWITYENLCTP